MLADSLTWFTGSLNRTEPSLALQIPPGLFLLRQVKMFSLKITLLGDGFAQPLKTLTKISKCSTFSLIVGVVGVLTSVLTICSASEKSLSFVVLSDNCLRVKKEVKAHINISVSV